MDVRATLQPATADDIIFGIPPGLVRSGRVPAAPRSTPVGALLEAVRAASHEGPCFVGFSGGCDSSLVLAACTRVRRMHGLPDPVPVTLRYEHPSTEERAYQDAMIAHLQLRDWHIVDVAGRQDLLSDTAQESLLDRGVFWPGTAHASGWLWKRLGPGAYLTGEGGDEVFGPRRSTGLAEVLRYALRGHRLPTRRIARVAVESVAPAAVRARGRRAQLLAGYGAEWLRPPERDRLVDLAVRGETTEPFRSRRWFEQHLARRRVAIGIENVQAHAASFGVAWHAPLLDPRFLGALVAHVTWHEYRGRPIILRHHFAELLPPLLLERTTKATFNAAFFGDDTRRFARDWDGGGLPDVVDADWLRTNWLSDMPHAGTAMLLQAAWLASRAPALHDAVAAAHRGT